MSKMVLDVHSCMLYSRKDHVFVLSSIIDSRKHEGKSISAAFIDMSKAFDCINRDMLYFKLLKIRLMEICVMQLLHFTKKQNHVFK